MSDDLVFMDLGPQNDGEPVAVEQEPVQDEPTAEQPEAEQPAEPEAEHEEPEAEEQPKKKTGSQRLKEKLHQREQELEYWRQQALNAKPAQEVPKPVEVDGKPKPEDYETHADWVEAVTDWKVEQKLKAQAEQSKAQKYQQEWETQAKDARARYEDFDDALQSAPAPSPAVAEAIAESPVKADLAYYLATHEDEYAQINRLPTVAAARAVALIEAKLAAPKKPETKAPAVTKAPKPPTPVAAPPAVKPGDDGRLVIY